MRLQVLGQLELRDRNGVTVPLAGRRNQGLVCVLAMEAARPVSDERVFDALWPAGDGPRDPAGTLRTYITRLRRALGAELIDRSPGGYRLRLDADDVDVKVSRTG